MRIKIAIKIAFALSFLFFLNNCGESLPDKPQLTSAQSNTKQNSIKSRLFGSWSVFESLGNETFSTRPHISNDSIKVTVPDNNNAIVNWSFTEDSANALTNRNQVLSRDSNGSWIANSPVAGNSNAKSLAIKAHPQTGDTVAAWIENGSVFTNNFTATNGWGQAKNLGSGDKLILSEIENNKLLLVWQDTSAIAFIVSAAQYDFSGSWSASFSLTQPATVNNSIAAPILLNNENFLFVWWEQELANPALQRIKNSEFSPILGWSNAVTVPIKINHQHSSELDLVLAMDKTSGQAFLFTANGTGTTDYGIYTSTYQSNPGEIQPWTEALRLIDLSQAIAPTKNLKEPLQFKAKYSANGNVALLWIDNSTDNINQYHSVKILTYRKDTGWNKPQLIAPPLVRFRLTSPPASNVNFMHTPRLAMNDVGEVHAAWLETRSGIQQIMTTRKLAATDWAPAEIVNVETAEAALLHSLDLDANNNRDARIAWIQEVNDATGYTFNLFTSDYNKSTVSTSPFDPSFIKPRTHITSTDLCIACHTATALIVDHNETIGTCSSCHDGIIASGKSPTHIPSTDNCETCHFTGWWTPAIAVDHNEVLGACFDCHNGVFANGQPVNHITSTNRCEACHSYTLWSPATRVDHAEVLGSCEACHDTVVATGKSVNHVATTAACDACHSTTAWVPALAVPLLRSLKF